MGTADRVLRVLLMVAVAGCTYSFEDTAEDIRQTTVDTRYETNRYLEASMSAPSPHYMRQELTRHRYQLAPILSDMAETVGEMPARCDDEGLSQMFSELDTELRRHLAVMAVSEDLMAMQAEVRRHATTINAVVDAMETVVVLTGCR